MKLYRYLLLTGLLLLMLNIYGIVSSTDWLVLASRLLFYVGLIGFKMSYLRISNLNLSAFFSFFIIAEIVSYFNDYWYLGMVGLLLYMAAYIFLSREAVLHTERSSASKYMLLYFVLVILVNAYLMLLHVLELQFYVSGFLNYGLYLVYYINLLVLGVVGLVYYLNSYSKKSVFFISLALALIFADVFRDMTAFYLEELGVLVLENFLRLAAITLAFFFFATEEKKLRLLNMV
ncbi:hypothetical protein [Salegentibacter chungangensis]|uniref:YhhN-like protein n=1 Tax=Salegentibacter chungangensis TaxID=1335724 RepID=A0ABW3NVG5_9FLAO